MSTFNGLELAKRALFAQQGALYTTGHNIANVNTEGYSRQRVNFVTSSPFPVPSRVQPQIPGQVGTGVDMGTVVRIRDKFLDTQYRAESSKLSYWKARSEALSRMEDLLNEPSDNGLSKTMDLFWQSLQELAANPENAGARAVVAERGLTLAETFNHLSKSLQSIQADLREQIELGSVMDINSLVMQIDDINKQIQKIEPHGFLANDLYDDRDRLIDQLSEIVNIKVTYSKSSNSTNELDVAEGLVSIEILDERGQSFSDPVYLIDVENDEVNNIEFQFNDTNGLIESIQIGSKQVFGSGASVNILDSIGSLTALVEAHGYLDNGNAKGDYPEMIQKLDDLAQAIAKEFNRVHKLGINIENNPGEAFFYPLDEDAITAETITVNPDIVRNPSLIAASNPDKGSSNGENALALAYVFDEDINELDDTSPRKFFTALIGELGVEGQRAVRMKNNTEILRDQVDHTRMSVSAVSLDEEISNMIKFQHAYNAAARSMTVVDEMIDRIINSMGLVGR